MRTLTPPPPPRISVRILRVAGWNLLLIIAGLVVIAAVGEVYVRLFTPFQRNIQPSIFVPGVGVIHEPGAESRWTNHIDYWIISRANSWGFLDREPISPERAAESCHVTIIGDSFVEAREVSIADKVQVQLDELAAGELPELDVTTSGFGIRGSAHINQLPLYDRYVSQLSPKLLVIVFTWNDLWGSSPVLSALYFGYDPDRAPYVFAERAADGTMKLRPPSPDYEPLLGLSERTWLSRALGSLSWSEFAAWLGRKLPGSVTESSSFRNVMLSRMEILKGRPGYETIHDGWTSANKGQFQSMVVWEDPPPVFREGPAFAEFALDEFMERAGRDGAALVILATHLMGDRNSRPWLLLNEMATSRGIPLINLHEYIIAQGATIGNAQFSWDHHWNAAGHQWAAEALLEHLKENQEICDTIDQADAEHTRS